MDKLSNLLQEAKPLYKVRKRRRAALKVAFCVCVPMFLSLGLYNVYEEGNNIYLSIKNNSLQNELILDEFGLYR